MTRQQLAHLLRRACAVVGDVDVLVLGSQSILGSFDENELPPQATASQEADIAFVNDPARDKADHVDVAIGEMSDFHRSNGVYAEGVHIDTAILPNGWRDRLVSWTVESSRPAKPRFLEPHDLAVAKLAAGRGEGQSFRGRPHPKRPARRGCDPGSGFAAAGGNRPAYRSTHCGLAELLRCGQPLLLAPVAPPALHAADVAAARRVGRPEVDAMCSRLPPVFGMGQLPAFQSSCPRYPFVDVGPAGPWRARWRVGS